MSTGIPDAWCCGTGGFLLAAHDYVVRGQGSALSLDQKRHLGRTS